MNQRLANNRVLDGTQVLAPIPPDRSNQFRVAAFGDSLMWGQGLARDRRFSYLIAEEIAVTKGKRPVIAYDWSRSGAKINASRQERTNFVATHWQLFKANTPGGGRQARTAFVDGDEAIAHELYGEVPETFPTVTFQVSNMPARLGSTIDLALVSGGGNDVGLDDLLDPEEFEGEFVPRWEAEFARIAYDDTYELLQRVRTKCPNAVILYFGYMRPFSYESSNRKMMQMAKDLKNSDLAWALNRILGIKDVEAILWEIRSRSDWALGRAAYWQKQAVMMANEDDQIRGPGIVYSPSGFLPENAALAPRPLVHEGYLHKTNDDLVQERLDECPRINHLALMEKISVARIPTTNGFPSNNQIKEWRSLLKDDGPLQILNATADIVNARRDGSSGDVMSAIASLGEAAVDEVARIQRTRIASFIHPNRAGARQYSDVAIRRYADHAERRASLNQVLPVPQIGQAETPAELLTRFGLRSRRSLVADLGHLDVDSLGVFAITASDSEASFVPNMFLLVDTEDEKGNIGSRRYLLNMPVRVMLAPTQPVPTAIVKKHHPELEPRSKTLFTVDTGGDLLLRDITKLSLELGTNDVNQAFAGRNGSVWRPRRVILSINGVTVHDRTFRSKELKPKERLAFEYPPAYKAAKPPVIVSARRSRPGVAIPSQRGPGVG